MGGGRYGGGRVYRVPAGLAGTQLRHSMAELRTSASAAYQCRDLRFWWLGAVRDQLLRGATHLPDQAVHAQAGQPDFLGLATGYRRRCHQPASGLHPGQGIRRAGMASGLADCRDLGVLCHRVLRHYRYPQGQAHLCGQLVLRCFHSGRGPAAHRQQYFHPRRLDEELLGLRRRAGRDGSVVVRAQRRGLLPDRRLPGHDVLLHPQAGGPSRVFVSPVDRALLGADLHVHVGGSSPPALHRFA